MMKVRCFFISFLFVCNFKFLSEVKANVAKIQIAAGSNRSTQMQDPCDLTFILISLCVDLIGFSVSLVMFLSKAYTFIFRNVQVKAGKALKNAMHLETS